MKLHALDWVILVASLAVCFLPAVFFGKRSGRNTTEFFASGRSVPWWLAGLSMVATTFSSDTPNLVTDIVRRQGVAGNWQWWSFVLTGVATVFFFARLWRRSGALTDLEFYELRYSGKAARVVRGFRAVYLGFFFNCVIMATVNLAAVKIANVLFGLPDWQTLLFVGLLNVVFAAHSGLWGVLVIDMVQFFIKMSAVIAAAFFAVKAVGGLDTLVAKVGAMQGPADGAVPGFHYLDVLPALAPRNSGLWDLAVAVFWMPIAVQWWAVWYPGSEPGGGSYIAQRMLASRSERDALGGVLFFNVAHYVLRPWPWILVGLCSLVVFPELSDIRAAFPNLDPKWIGHDIAYPAMISRVLPVGFMGLMVGGLIAANSSTILTHLNWGASYLVHDFYKRFLRPARSEQHYVAAGRIVTVGLFVCSAGTMYLMTSAKDSFDLILQVGAGTGLLYILRWFWWRINAWCEVVAMASSFLLSFVFLVVEKQGHHVASHARLIITIVLTTSSWLVAAYLGPTTDEATLLAFYRKVKPFGPGWRRFQKLEDLASAEPATGENIPLALVGWASGCATIWSSLFLVGNVLYGKTAYAVICGGVFALSAIGLVAVIRRTWQRTPSPQTRDSCVSVRAQA